ncbi:hypothetical protein Pcinc_009342 [Petrolisthes cinctipes]|uniref:Major facilitator superfamily (MFS) profile domain-containing protein n=1 Tax=Petrolisthes cinctipes TaxID=88211 RepID=A0AAE1G7I3_PETCI|nr:hypothetical protein Pcinc_009342 [Petrolisthes cinctipes]
MVPPQFLSGVYLTPAVNYTCRLPDNQTHHAVVAEDSCSYIITNSSDDGPGLEELCTEWDFDTSVFSSTLTSEFSLVCERGYLRATYQSMYMLGTLFCPVIGGYLADRFGRYVVVVVTQVVMLFTSHTVVFLNSFTAILAVRFIAGSSNMLTLYILALEVCEPKHRAAVGILTGLPWALGTMAWAGAAFAIRDWRYLQLAVSLPILLIFPPLYFMDESPRWLIVRGRHDRALTVLQKAARWNKATLPPNSEMRTLMIDIQAESTENTSKTKDNNLVEVKKKKCRAVPVPNLLKNRAIATITTLLCLDYFVVSLVFDGLNMSGDNYSADPFLYLVLSGLVEVPGYSLTAPLIDRCGRKIPTAVCYLLCGVVILALAFIPPGMSWLVMVMVLFGKLCITGAFQIIIVYSSELFPTEVRLQGIGISSVFSQLGSTILPYITSVLLPQFVWKLLRIVCGRWEGRALWMGRQRMRRQRNLQHWVSANSPYSVRDMFGWLARRKRTVGGRQEMRRRMKSSCNGVPAAAFNRFICLRIGEGGRASVGLYRVQLLHVRCFGLP